MPPRGAGAGAPRRAASWWRTCRPTCASPRPRFPRESSSPRSRGAPGCGILLDVNNAWVNAVNHGCDVRAIPRRHRPGERSARSTSRGTRHARRARGHARRARLPGGVGALRGDDPRAWGASRRSSNGTPTFPALDVLLAEAARADAILVRGGRAGRGRRHDGCRHARAAAGGLRGGRGGGRRGARSRATWRATRASRCAASRSIARRSPPIAAARCARPFPVVARLVGDAFFDEAARRLAAAFHRHGARPQSLRRGLRGVPRRLCPRRADALARRRRAARVGVARGAHGGGRATLDFEALAARAREAASPRLRFACIRPCGWCGRRGRCSRSGRRTSRDATARRAGRGGRRRARLARGRARAHGAPRAAGGRVRGSARRVASRSRTPPMSRRAGTSRPCSGASRRTACSPASPLPDPMAAPARS